MTGPYEKNGTISDFFLLQNGSFLFGAIVGNCPGMWAETHVSAHISGKLPTYLEKAFPYVGSFPEMWAVTLGGK